MMAVCRAADRESVHLYVCTQGCNAKVMGVARLKVGGGNKGKNSFLVLYKRSHEGV